MCSAPQNIVISSFPGFFVLLFSLILAGCSDDQGISPNSSATFTATLNGNDYTYDIPNNYGQGNTIDPVLCLLSPPDVSTNTRITLNSPNFSIDIEFGGTLITTGDYPIIDYSLRQCSTNFISMSIGGLFSNDFGGDFDDEYGCDIIVGYSQGPTTTLQVTDFTNNRISFEWNGLMQFGSFLCVEDEIPVKIIVNNLEVN